MYEVPINYHGRTYAEGKKIRGYHALAVVRTIVIERLGDDARKCGVTEGGLDAAVRLGK